MIFTKIRTALNDREDELLKEVEQKFDNTYFNEDINKTSEKLPKKIKESLEKGKIIDNKWNDYKLNLIIKDCIIIENNISDINIINNNIKKSKSFNHKIHFEPDKNAINDFVKIINNFGSVKDFYIFSLKECPLDIKEERKFIISGNRQNIITKTGKNQLYMGTIGKLEFDQFVDEYKWKIKILKTEHYYIMAGVATMDFDFNKASWEVERNFGWYYWFNNGTLFSGNPHNYSFRNIGLNSQVNEIIIIMNKKKRALKFIINNEDKGDSYTNIPLDKPIPPSILLYHTNDSVEILEY